ncbi:hypothetical protein BH23PLA1_BH23PLA1_26100 [soil metagenome]
MIRTVAPLLACGLVLVLTGTWVSLADSRPDEDEVEFEADVRPILDLYCFECHGSKTPEAGLRLDSIQAILEGGDGGPAIVPGKSAESLLFEVLTNEEGFRMPPEGEPVPEEEIEIIRAWIDQGAKVE